MKRRYILDVISILLIILFLYTGVTKLKELETFRMQLGKSPFVSEFASILSIAIPVIEITVCVMLCFKKTSKIALLCSFGLMAAFTLYIAAMLTLSYTVPCSCGGVIESLSWEQHLVFNLFFVGASLYAFLTYDRYQIKDLT